MAWASKIFAKFVIWVSFIIIMFVVFVPYLFLRREECDIWGQLIPYMYFVALGIFIIMCLVRIIYLLLKRNNKRNFLYTTSWRPWPPAVWSCLYALYGWALRDVRWSGVWWVVSNNFSAYTNTNNLDLGKITLSFF